MASELQAWNQGRGIDLQSWVGCKGSFALAVGYTSIFWPRLVEFEGYILHEGFSVESLRGFEASYSGNRLTVEATINHRHIADIQHLGCEDLTQDKILLLGNVLHEIYEAKLLWQFPDRPCKVSFFAPEDPADLMGYQVTFWQEAHDPRAKA
ncbi:MAG TPA: hypothetical protein VFB32_17915 [Rudaea sp.]|nr:hypothetical protein [Rudaea sp.]